MELTSAVIYEEFPIFSQLC